LFYTTIEGTFAYNISAQTVIKLVNNTGTYSGDPLFNAGDNKIVIIRGSDTQTAYAVDLAGHTLQQLKAFSNSNDSSYSFVNFYNESVYLMINDVQTTVGIAEHLVIVKNGVEADLGVIGYNPQRGISYADSDIRSVLSPDGIKNGLWFSNG